MHRFLKSSRAEHQQEVSSVSGEVILSPRGGATSICPVTGQLSLAPISVTRIAISSILRWTFPLRGALRAYPVPLKGRDRLDLLSTPAVLITHDREPLSLCRSCETVANRIAAEVKAGNCACEVKNPSGKCCLGDVTQAAKDGMR